MFLQKSHSEESLDQLSLRQLALLGDAVFHLFERERELLLTSSACQMHRRARVSAKAQAELLHQLSPALTDKEKDIVRRARNMKPAHYKASDQSEYRRATAFEALLGYLYLSDENRLIEILMLTLGQVRQ